MLKKIILAFALLFNSFLSSAQWEVKHINSSSAEGISTIKFIDGNNGYAMGDSGLILKTTDQGETWQNIENNIESDIWDFEIISLDTLIAITTFYDEVFKGTVLKSTDGGITWEEKHTGQGFLRSVQFLNSSKGLICFSEELLMTNDSGESWEPVFNVAQGDYDIGNVIRFDMVNDSIGYAIGLGEEGGANSSVVSFLAKTIDGGKNWEMISEYDDWFQRIDFVDEKYGFITNDSLTYRTFDGGITWDTLNNLLGVVGISIPSMDKIVTVNHPFFYLDSNPKKYAVNISEDSGDSWDGALKVGPHLDAVFFLSDSVGFVAGEHSIILKTEHGGGEFPHNYPDGFLFNSTKDLIVESFEIYPNPVSDKLYFKDLDNLTSLSYKITSLNAQTLMEGKLVNAELDVSDLEKGIYFITIQSDGYLKTARILKM